jgi:hypothetical protein
MTVDHCIYKEIKIYADVRSPLQGGNVVFSSYAMFSNHMLLRPKSRVAVRTHVALALLVGVDDSSTYRLAVARPSRIRDVPGSIPGLAYLFSSYISVIPMRVPIWLVLQIRISSGFIWGARLPSRFNHPRHPTAGLQQATITAWLYLRTRFTVSQGAP